MFFHPLTFQKNILATLVDGNVFLVLGILLMHHNGNIIVKCKKGTPKCIHVNEPVLHQTAVAVVVLFQPNNVGTNFDYKYGEAIV
jgi:hypothetical protein